MEAATKISREDMIPTAQLIDLYQGRSQGSSRAGRIFRGFLHMCRRQG